MEQTARYFGGHYSAFVVTKNGRMGGLLFASPVVAAKLHILVFCYIKILFDNFVLEETYSYQYLMHAGHQKDELCPLANQAL